MNFDVQSKTTTTGNDQAGGAKRYAIALMCGIVLFAIASDACLAGSPCWRRARLSCRRLSHRPRVKCCKPCCHSKLAASSAKSEATAEKDPYQVLFDGKTLEGWKSTLFGGEGEVYVEDGAIVLEFGSSLTGVTYTKEFPKLNYEVELEAKKVSGGDFFCGMTFPVKDSYCSFIVGGWGGAVVGISSIDGMDASENDTTQYMNFKAGQWYKIRVRVTKDKIQTWIDGEVIVDQIITDRRIDTRMEVDLSRPFGVASFDTQAALRNIKLRMLNSGEIKE